MASPTPPAVKKPVPPFPKRQMFVLGMCPFASLLDLKRRPSLERFFDKLVLVLTFPVSALCRIAEPIAFMGIFPYIYFMIKDFKITEDETMISFYAGMVNLGIHIC